MASEGKFLFDLNELPAEDTDENDNVICNQPQKAIPSANLNISALLATPSSSQDKVFSHASTVSGFQPFVRPVSAQRLDVSVERKMDDDSRKESLSSSRSDILEEAKVAASVVPNDYGAPEREEGEWTESEVPANENEHSTSVTEKDNGTVGFDINSNLGLQKRNVNHISESMDKDSASIDSLQEQGSMVRQREAKGVEASHAIKCANTTVKRKLDHQKETMLGKKRNRQTMFLNLEDVKQAGPIKTTTPRRQNFPQPVVKRTVRESRAGPSPAENGGGIPGHVVYRDQNPTEIPNGDMRPDASVLKLESNVESQSGSIGKTRKMNREARPSAEGRSVSRQGSWKQPLRLNSSHSANK